MKLRVCKADKAAASSGGKPSLISRARRSVSISACSLRVLEKLTLLSAKIARGETKKNWLKKTGSVEVYLLLSKGSRQGRFLT